MTNHVFVVTCTHVLGIEIVKLVKVCIHEREVSNVRICTAEIALIYKSNINIARVVRELFSVEGIKIDRKIVAKYYERFQPDGFLSVTCLVAVDRQHWIEERKHFDFINQKLSWNKTMS